MASRYSLPPCVFGTHSPGLPAVVEVHHRGHRVDPQRVEVELGQPVQRAGDQERPHLVAREVEDVGAPLLVLTQPVVGMLVQGSAVEATQRPVVLREVPRDPVEDHSDAGLMQPVDEVAQLVGAAEAGLRREEAGHLVPPRGHQGMLGDRHELDMGVAHRRHVLDERIGQVQVGQPRAPRPQVHLVDRDRGLLGSEGGALGHPLVIAPGVVGLVDDGRVRGGRLGEPGHRVDLLPPHTVGSQDVVLVQGPLADALDEHRPHPGAGYEGHRVASPGVEVALDPNRLRVRRPEREPGPPDLASLLSRHRDDV